MKRSIRKIVQLTALICLFSMIITSICVAGEGQESIKGDFQNRLNIFGPNPDNAISSSAAFFGGHQIEYALPGTSDEPTVPTDGSNHYLVESSFGQMVARNVPIFGFEENALQESTGMLYEGADAAFRYKSVLYEIDGSAYIRALFETIRTNWDESDRAKALQAEEILRDALRYAPSNTQLRQALLDIYYDMAVADLEVAKDRMKEAKRAALGIDHAAPAGGFLISEEIPLLESAVTLYRNAMSRYFDLLNDPMGIAVSDVYPSVMEPMPYGYYLFKTDVPDRSLVSAIPGDDTQLFAGYKDLVLLFTIQKGYVQAAEELATRYMARNSGEDVNKALNLIGDVYQAAYVEGQMLLEMFPDYHNADPASGLVETVRAWEHALTKLTHLRHYVDRGINMLGFTNDFLVLAQKSNGSSFDSYDHFASLMNTGSLYIATSDLKEAKVEYAEYRDRSDQLASQFYGKNESYNERLRQIVGALPGDAQYDTPYENEGSEISIQGINIQRAMNRIEINRTEIENLKKQIETEIWLRGQEKNINYAIQQVYLKYGNKYASISAKIGEIDAEQQLTSSLASAFGSFAKIIIPPEKQSDPQPSNAEIREGRSPVVALAIVEGVSSIISGLFGSNSANRKARLAAQRERLAAAERAEIVALQDDLMDANSKALIKNLFLRMNTLALESLEASLLLDQEFARLAALENEKHSLEIRKNEYDAFLAERYFADPAHRLLAASSIDKAELSFKNAQKWMLITLRALEYKWNQPFTHIYGGRSYSEDTLMKLRNAEELNDMFHAMDDWDNKMAISGRTDDCYAKFSYRQDFLGYRDGSMYHDPISGELVDARQAFRSYLSHPHLTLSVDDPDNKLELKSLQLDFSTVKAKESIGFFSRSNWLDKITFLRVKVYGGAPSGSNSTLQGFLQYGGTSYIRNQYRGTPDPTRPDRYIDEMTAYPTRFWYYDASLSKWLSKETMDQTIDVQVANDPEVPPSVYQIDVFQERSVATSEWKLYLPVEDEGGNELIDIENITDIEIHFYYYRYSRMN